MRLLILISFLLGSISVHAEGVILIRSMLDIKSYANNYIYELETSSDCPVRLENPLSASPNDQIRIQFCDLINLVFSNRDQNNSELASIISTSSLCHGVSFTEEDSIHYYARMARNGSRDLSGDSAWEVYQKNYAIKRICRVAAENAPNEATDGGLRSETNEKDLDIALPVGGNRSRATRNF